MSSGLLGSSSRLSRRVSESHQILHDLQCCYWRELGYPICRVEGELAEANSDTPLSALKYSHVSRKSNLKVGQPSFRVDVPERAHAIDDETVILNGCLEALQAVPYRTMIQSLYGLNVDTRLQVMLKKDRRVSLSGHPDWGEILTFVSRFLCYPSQSILNQASPVN